MSIEIKELTRDDIDEMMQEHLVRAQCLCLESVGALEDYKYNAAHGMIKFGGSFVNFLGQALMRADSKNTLKIISSFRDYCDKYAPIYKQWEQVDRFKDLQTED